MIGGNRLNTFKILECVCLERNRFNEGLCESHVDGASLDIRHVFVSPEQEFFVYFNRNWLHVMHLCRNRFCVKRVEAGIRRATILVGTKFSIVDQNFFIGNLVDLGLLCVNEEHIVEFIKLDAATFNITN